MKVLFAVNNDNISDAIVKRYQQDYKEILSYKNVYYFNAILKELQKDKTYNRIVISEDLEPFANNNYSLIDKFLSEKMSKIGEETKNGETIETILICTDRRKKGDDILAKYFGVGIYNAIIGDDRSITTICNLINQTRTQKDAKIYYKINIDSSMYQGENENSVSEAEVQNILAHYKRLGKNEDKYVESFNNIVTQYTDDQLKIIVRCLPIQVRSVLEEKSLKYQELVTFAMPAGQKELNNYSKPKVKEKKADTEPSEITILEEEANRKKINKPIIVPTMVDTEKVKKILTPKVEIPKPIEPEIQEIVETIEENIETPVLDTIHQNIEVPNVEIQQEEVISKKGRGRPRKYPVQPVQEEPREKRGRGRPKKNIIEEVEEIEEETKQEEIINQPLETTKNEEIDLFNIDEQPKQVTQPTQEVNLFSLDEDEEEPDLFAPEEKKPETAEPGLFSTPSTNITQKEPDLFNLDKGEPKKDENDIDLFNVKEENKNDIIPKNIAPITSNLGSLLTRDKKVVAFVGTTKNGTSFIVNNTAEVLSNMGISTAILDMTTTKNAYYIYTNNEETLRTRAKESIEKLERNIAEGIQVNKNLTVYTSLPGEKIEYNAEKILSTLLQKHAVILIDTDFSTPVDFFARSQELYLVQTLDVLTIQPLTAFLRNLKSKNILDQEKLRIVINKYQKVKGLDVRTLVGGIAFYNDPSMSFMTELFNKDGVQYCQIPFELENYSKYLESLVTCSVTLNGYTKQLLTALKGLAGMVYPLINQQSYSPIKRKEHFSNETNDTLRKMKNNY